MVHVVLVPTVHCCNKVVLNRPCCVFASWLFSAKLFYKILHKTLRKYIVFIGELLSTHRLFKDSQEKEKTTIAWFELVLL